MNKNFYFPNHNPYLLWAATVGPDLRFLRFYRPMSRAHRRGSLKLAAKIRARFNDLPPYTTEELERTPVTMATNQRAWVITEAGPWLKSKKFTP